MKVDAPVNVHLTGCHHSCAQHYIGDIGLIAAKVDVGDDETVEGYHVLVGGGYGEERRLAREIFRDVKASDAPEVVARACSRRGSRAAAAPGESFFEFANRHEPEQLQALFGPPLKAVA